MTKDGGGVFLSKRHEDGIQTESPFMKSPSVSIGQSGGANYLESLLKAQTLLLGLSESENRVLKNSTSFTSSTLNIPMKCKAGNWDVMESLRKE